MDIFNLILPFEVRPQVFQGVLSFPQDLVAKALSEINRLSDDIS